MNYMESVNIKELNERIQQESAFVDLLSLEMGKVIVGQKHLVENLMIAMQPTATSSSRACRVWPRPSPSAPCRRP